MRGHLTIAEADKVSRWKLAARCASSSQCEQIRNSNRRTRRLKRGSSTLRTLQQSGDLTIARFDRLIYSPAAELKALDRSKHECSFEIHLGYYRHRHRHRGCGALSRVGVEVPGRIRDERGMRLGPKLVAVRPLGWSGSHRPHRIRGALGHSPGMETLREVIAIICLTRAEADNASFTEARCARIYAINFAA